MPATGLQWAANCLLKGAAPRVDTLQDLGGTPPLRIEAVPQVPSEFTLLKIISHFFFRLRDGPCSPSNSSIEKTSVFQTSTRMQVSLPVTVLARGTLHHPAFTLQAELLKAVSVGPLFSLPLLAKLSWVDPKAVSCKLHWFSVCSVSELCNHAQLKEENADI